MRPANLNALKMFDAAARHLNFRLAAQELNLTQGAVAQQVRRLEASLQVSLFTRRARGLELTDSGREYQHQISRALAIIDTATAKLQRQNTQIIISVPPSFASKWLVPNLAKFTTQYPQIDLQTIASEQLSDFKKDAVDIAIRIARAPFASDLDAQLLAPLNLCAVCSAEFAANNSAITCVDDFFELPLIQDGHLHWNTLLEKVSDTKTAKVLQFNQTALAIDAASNGQGIALSPLFLVAPEIASGKLIDLWRPPSEGAAKAYYLLSKKSATENPARDKVIQWLLNEASSASEQGY